MNVFVIGGGASGLTSAIVLARRGFKVSIIEQNNKFGKKLLLTGNGRCNFWNEVQSLDKYHSQNMNLLETIFNLEKDEVLKFFDSIGIVPKIVNGYYYPFANQAISIVNALVNTLKNLNVNFILEEKLLKIEKDGKFKIYTDKNMYWADKVVLAMGSKANFKTGSDGFGYEIVKKLGHTVTKINPSLVQITSDDNFLKDLDGVRSEVVLTLWQDGKMVKKEPGEVQFTHYGLSGICSFNLSGLINKNNLLKQEILINLVPWFKGNEDDLIKFLDGQEKKLNSYSLAQILEGFLNYKIVNVILKLNKISLDTKWKSVNKKKIVNTILNFKVNVKGTMGFDMAQVCCGGVLLSEINVNTMESLKVKGLYIVGEILDVDGDCGGYNLGFAWMSGLLAGKSVNCD